MSKPSTHPGIRRHRGKWQARYRDPTGRQRSKSFDRKIDAIQFAADMRADMRRGSWIDPERTKQPYRVWAEEWLRGLHSMGPGRRANAEAMMRNHILPAFGNVPIGSIGPVEVRRWVNELTVKPQKRIRGRTLGPWGVRAIYGLFARSMRAAVAARLIPEAPVGREIVDLPEVTRKRERFLTEAEVERLAARIAPQHRALILTAAWTGCRWGELTGLLKENLDLERGEFRVRSVASRITASRTELKSVPKTKSGRRNVSLPAQLVAVLEEQVAAYPESRLVFPDRDGGVLSYGNFRTRHWDPAVDEAGLAPLSFHDLRHTHVTWLIDAGWNEFRIVRRLGWKDGRMLHTVYGHLFRDHDEELIAGLEGRWNRSTVPAPK